MSAKILGTNDDQTVCDCCGKTNLKKTVIIDLDGKIVAYGVDCAAKLLKQNKKTTTDFANAAATARAAFDRGLSAEQVASIVWNRFGLQSNVKTDSVEFIFGTIAK